MILAVPPKVIPKNNQLLKSLIVSVSSYDWPKNDAPSGFTMKLRKHLNNKRLEKISMVGTDRVVDLQFGSGDAGYHLVLAP